MNVSIFIPTMWRAKNLPMVVDSIRSTTEGYKNDFHTPYFATVFKIYGMCPEADYESRDFFDASGIKYWTDSGDMRFVRRIQFMFENTDDDWFLTGADDIRFHQGWFDAAAEYFNTHAVISFEDQCNPTIPGTNFLINRKYIQYFGGTFDNQKYLVLGQDYQHNFCDNELVAVASNRGLFVKCDGVIEHVHPSVGKAEMDDTYRWATDRFHQDGALFNARSQGIL